MFYLSHQDPDDNPEYDNPLGRLPNGFNLADDQPTTDYVDFRQHSKENRDVECDACVENPLDCECKCRSCAGRRGAAKRKQDDAEVDQWVEDNKEDIMKWRYRATADFQRENHIAILDMNTADKLSMKVFNNRWERAIAAPTYGRWDAICSTN